MYKYIYMYITLYMSINEYIPLLAKPSPVVFSTPNSNLETPNPGSFSPQPSNSEPLKATWRVSWRGRGSSQRPYTSKPFGAVLHPPPHL